MPCSTDLEAGTRLTQTQLVCCTGGPLSRRKLLALWGDWTEQSHGAVRHTALALACALPFVLLRSFLHQYIGKSVRHNTHEVLSMRFVPSKVIHNTHDISTQGLHAVGIGTMVLQCLCCKEEPL